MVKLVGKPDLTIIKTVTCPSNNAVYKIIISKESRDPNEYSFETAHFLGHQINLSKFKLIKKLSLKMIKAVA